MGTRAAICLHPATWTLIELFHVKSPCWDRLLFRFIDLVYKCPHHVTQAGFTFHILKPEAGGEVLTQIQLLVQGRATWYFCRTVFP